MTFDYCRTKYSFNEIRDYNSSVYYLMDFLLYNGINIVIKARILKNNYK